jgi:hypothetical protein
MEKGRCKWEERKRREKEKREREEREIILKRNGVVEKMRKG